MAEHTLDRSATLLPYLPRLLMQWLTDAPDTPWREVDGTVVFVDISGFTKLSEKLAKSGKVGAEELADAIGSCFARLLAVAYGNGGGLIKFGGDALLLLFTGQDHPAKACRAAVGMRRALREIGRIETSGGKVGLRMSVGVHSGTFNFFLVGGSHRELIVTGPSATTTATMEGTAEAGEILVSQATAGLLLPRVLGGPKGPGILLRSEPPGLSPDRPDTDIDVTADDVESCIPIGTREYLLYGTHEPEHRQVAIAFLHFDGTDAMIEREGSRAFAAHMDVLVRDVQAAVDEHEICFLGSDVDKDGGKIILTAGAPRATGNDEERLLLAVRRIASVDRAIPIRIGVNRGRVFAGDIGPPYRRTYTVMGDAVNLSARVMAAAKPGQVLVTGEVLERSRTTFGTVALEPFFVKGKAKPVQAYELGGVAGARRETTGGTGAALPLVGRDKEMAAVREVLGEARRGRGRLVEIVGEPGIGKSRLLEEIRVEAARFTQWSMACELYESSTPYFPFRRALLHALGDEDLEGEGAAEALRNRVAEIAPQLLPWLPLLAVPLDVNVPETPETLQLEDEFRKTRLEQAVADLLRALSPSTALLTVEDAHWMDEASVDLLRYLATGIRHQSAAIVTTRRDVGTGFVAGEHDDALSLRPAPLGAADAAALASAATDDAPLAPHELAALAERSGGNPLFLKELVQAARAAGGLEGLPDSVEAVITAQIDSLRPADRTLLRYASVLGQTFSEDLATAVLARELPGLEGDPWSYLSSFIVRGTSGQLRFEHALIRDAAYEGLPFRRRRALHALVGETIERSTPEPEDQAELLSMHFFNSDAMEKAWRYSTVAGERARSIYANVEAAEFYQRALESARRILVPPQQLAGIHEALGDVRDRAGKYEAAATAYTAARRIVAGDDLAAAGLLLKEAEMRERTGKYSQALRWYRRGLSTIEQLEGDDLIKDEVLRLRARLSVGYATILRGQTRNREAIEWSQRAIVYAEACGARDVVAHAAGNLDWIYTAMGQPQDAPYRGLALEIYEELNDLTGLHREYTNLGTYAYLEGRWDEAVEYYERGLEACQKTGDEVHSAMGRNNIGEILSDQGALADAEALFQEALRVWRAAGFREGVGHATGNLGRVASRAGRNDEAVELLGKARTLFEDIGEERMALEMDARIAESFVFAGEGGRALPLATETLRRTEKLGGWATVSTLLHRLRGEALVQAGDTAAAREALEESLRVGRERNADYEVGLTLEAMARLAALEDDPAETTYARESAIVLRRLGVQRTPAVPGPASA
jgi:class 3 adenylate cyclase/tetratricopeptide (TPR) repeat protein